VDRGNGYNWEQETVPSLCRLGGNGDLVVSFGECRTYWFTDNGDGTYSIKFGGRPTLKFGADCCFTFTDCDGSKWVFDADGAVLSVEYCCGQESTVEYDGNDRISTITREEIDNEDVRVYDRIRYTYDSNDRVQTVTTSRQVGPSSEISMRRVSYTYYPTTGDLKTATNAIYENSTWSTLDVTYYRYYTSTDGFAHGLKYEVGPEAYARLVENVGSDPDQWTPSQIEDYADRHFKYYTAAGIKKHRVKEVVVAGGSRKYQFDYTSGTSDTANLAKWSLKTTTTLPDGNREIVYTNALGQVLIREFVEELGETDKRWIDYYKYNSTTSLFSLLEEHATPAAITGYSDNAGTTHVITPTYNTADDGLIHLTEYYTSETGGGAPKHVRYRKIKNSKTGSTAIIVSETKYTKRTVSGFSVYFVSEQTKYKNENQTGGSTTEYTYGNWYQDSFQYGERTTWLPEVPTSEHGSGTDLPDAQRDIHEEIFDETGRVVWEKTLRGTINYFLYDPVTRAIVRQIQDVDMSEQSMPSNDYPLKPDWSTPTGGGSHLTTDFEYDDDGRTTQTLGPIHTVDLSGTATSVRTASWTVFKDSDHETRSVQGYATQGEGSAYDDYKTVGPVSIEKTDQAGRTVDAIQVAQAETDGTPSATTTYSQSDWCRWTRNIYGDASQLEATRVYHNIPTTDDDEGSFGTNYDETSFKYDDMGRQDRVETPGGTITRTVFDARGQVTSVWVGTDDEPDNGSWDPENQPQDGTNLLKTVTNKYDDGNDRGNGNLTEVTLHVDAGDRVHKYLYDWRDRREYEILPGDNASPSRVTYTKTEYDNLDRIVKVKRYYDSDNDIDTAGPEPDDPDTLLAQTETKFDVRGRVYQTIRYAVDAGTAGNSLIDRTWYDASDQVIKSRRAGSKRFIKSTYDLFGRVDKQYVGYNTVTESYSEAQSVANDTIFEQAEMDYDEAGNLIKTTAYARKHNGTGTGALTTSNARATYTGSWYDGIGRLVGTADYGTTSFDRTSVTTTPTRTNDRLVTTIEYNHDGEAYKTVDPKETETHTEYDDVGRVEKVIQNYVSSPTDPDQNLTVETTYNADGLVATLTAKQASSSDDQVTTYVYGSYLGAVVEENGEPVVRFNPGIYREDLLRAVIYPDSTNDADDVADGTGTYDRVEYKYNRQGERIEVKDQEETIHKLTYDKLRRPIADAVELATSSPIDGRVLRIERSYRVGGMVEKVTSYDAASEGDVINEVKLDYNEFDQVATEYQAHRGEVDDETPGVSPNVQYSYTNGSNNHARLTGITYPNERVLHHEYSSGDDDNLSRVSYLSDANANGVRLAEYSGTDPNDATFTRLGLDRVVRIDFGRDDEDDPVLRYNLAHGTNEDDGLDAFDRVKDLRWTDYDGNTDRVRIKHGYDQASNRVWREDPVAASNSEDFDELYDHDGVYRLKEFDRGNLEDSNGGKAIEDGTLTFAEEWTLDATGNWTSFKQDTDTGTSGWELDQDRSHNKANEIDNITEETGNPEWPTPEHDKAGNMTEIPQPGDLEEKYDLTYDAWNRLVKVVDGTTVAEYRYDGLGRRIRKYVPGVSHWDVTEYYYSRSWQVLEVCKATGVERTGTPLPEPSVSTAVDHQFVWGIRYIDDLILRDRDVESEGDLGKSGSGLDERLYALQDPNFNVVALAESDGTIQERYCYTAYGASTKLNRNFTDWSGTAESEWEYLFTGRRWDEETGLYYYRARYYHAGLGRFVSRDPIGYELGDTNSYDYVAHNPGTFLDPDGLVVRVFAFEGMGGYSKDMIQYSRNILEEAVLQGALGHLVKDKKVVVHYYPHRKDDAVDRIIEEAQKKRSTKPECYDRIVLIGYSLGGGAVVEVLRELKSKDPRIHVDVVITLDPVPRILELPDPENDEITKKLDFTGAAEWTVDMINQIKIPAIGFARPVEGDFTFWINVFQRQGIIKGHPLKGDVTNLKYSLFTTKKQLKEAQAPNFALQAHVKLPYNKAVQGMIKDAIKDLLEKPLRTFYKTPEVKKVKP